MLWLLLWLVLLQWLAHIPPLAAMRITWSPLKRAMFYYVVWNRHIEQVTPPPLLRTVPMYDLTANTCEINLSTTPCHLYFAVRRPPVPHRVCLSPGRVHLGEVRRSLVQRAECAGGHGGPSAHDGRPHHPAVRCWQKRQQHQCDCVDGYEC